MTYEKTPVTKTKLNGKQLLFKGLERVGTLSLLWFLIKRHKMGLITAWAVIMTAIYIFPPLPELIAGLIP